jgi:hypothetical protein
MALRNRSSLPVFHLQKRRYHFYRPERNGPWCQPDAGYYTLPAGSFAAGIRIQKASRLHLYAGVYGGLNLGDDYGIRDDLDVPVAEKEEGRYFNRHDAGLLAGVTYDICRGEQWTWAGQLRYQHGLMDVTQEFDSPDPFQHQVRSVGLGIVLKRSNTPQAG